VGVEVDQGRLKWEFVRVEVNVKHERGVVVPAAVSTEDK
jgi:hypothetical protein